MEIENVENRSFLFIYLFEILKHYWPSETLENSYNDGQLFRSKT